MVIIIGLSQLLKYVADEESLVSRAPINGLPHSSVSTCDRRVLSKVYAFLADSVLIMLEMYNNNFDSYHCTQFHCSKSMSYRTRPVST